MDMRLARAMAVLRRAFRIYFFRRRIRKKQAAAALIRRFFGDTIHQVQSFDY